jgi:zinc protease
MVGRELLRVVLVTAAALGAIVGEGPALAQTQVPAEAGKVLESRLPNGMVVVVQEDHRAPAVSLALRYDGGDRAAPADAPCVAPLTTMAMTAGTRHVAAGDYDKLLDRAGTSLRNWRTWEDGTLFQVTVPANEVALPLWLWSDQMGFFAAGDEKVLGAGRAALRELRRVSMEGSPAARLDYFASQVLFPEGHPYRHVGCVPEDVERVDGAAVRSFHDAWITPDHAALSIIGDVQASAALDLVRRYFASLPSSSAGLSVPRPPLARLSDQIEVDVAAPVQAAKLSIRWLTPRIFTDDDARLDVIARLFVGNRTGWLRWKLVDEAKVATLVTARQHSLALASYFEVDIDGAPGRTPREVLAAFDAAMAKTRAGQVTQAQIEGAVYETIVHRVLDLDAPAARAAAYLAYEDTVGVPAYVNHDMERFSQIRPPDIFAAIDHWLPADRRVVLFVSPNPSAPAGGEQLGTRRVPASSP